VTAPTDRWVEMDPIACVHKRFERRGQSYRAEVHRVSGADSSLVGITGWCRTAYGAARKADELALANTWQTIFVGRLFAVLLGGRK